MTVVHYVVLNERFKHSKAVCVLLLAFFYYQKLEICHARVGPKIWRNLNEAHIISGRKLVAVQTSALHTSNPQKESETKIWVR